MTAYKLGRRERHFDPRVPHLSAMRMMPGVQLPALQTKLDWAAKLPADLGMMLNDRLGDCVAEGTVVTADHIGRAYRGKYDGPMIVLTTESGKRLSVTPNHAVLTDRGFVRACSLKEGDYLVSARRPEVLASALFGTRKTHLDDGPSPVEKIFASRVPSGGAIRKVMPIAIDFHGDERSLYGNVEVVGADRFLWRQLNPSLRKPKAKDQIRSAGELQRRLASLRAPLESHWRRLSAFLRDMSMGHQGASLGYAHAGVAEAYGLSDRAQLVPRFHHGHFEATPGYSGLLRNALHGLARNVPLDPRGEVAVSVPRTHLGRVGGHPDFRASSHNPPPEGHPTDPRLARDLLNAVPGLIERDRLINIDAQRFRGHVYDISTDNRWYSADGIIVHNCTCAGIYHGDQIWTADAQGAMQTAPDALVQQLYEEVGGYNPNAPIDPGTGENSTDRGVVEQNMLAYLTATGFPRADGSRSKILGYVEVDPRNLTDVCEVIQEFGFAYIGFMVPDGFMQAGPPKTWALSPQYGNPVGGHCVVLTGFDRSGLTGKTHPMFNLVSWGERDWRMNAAFFEKYCDEVYGIVHQDWISATGRTPYGLSLEQLEALMQPLRMAA